MRKKYKATGIKEAKGKKGAAHIEMIMTFVLFISLLIFVFAFINPAKRIEPSKALLEIVSYEIGKNSSINITTISIKLNYTPAASCFKINLLELGIDGIAVNNKITIRNSSDDSVKSSKTNSDLDIETSGDFYKIFASEDFNAVPYSLSVCEAIKKDNITIGQITTRKAMSYERMLRFSSGYSENYKTLKQSINFPAGNDFGFVLRDSSKNVLLQALEDKPESAIVISKEEPIDVVYENSTSIVAVLNIQAW